MIPWRVLTGVPLPRSYPQETTKPLFVCPQQSCAWLTCLSLRGSVARFVLVSSAKRTATRITRIKDNWVNVGSCKVSLSGSLALFPLRSSFRFVPLLQGHGLQLSSSFQSTFFGSHVPRVKHEQHNTKAQLTSLDNSYTVHTLFTLTNFNTLSHDFVTFYCILSNSENSRINYQIRL